MGRAAPWSPRQILLQGLSANPASAKKVIASLRQRLTAPKRAPGHLLCKKPPGLSQFSLRSSTSIDERSPGSPPLSVDLQRVRRRLCEITRNALQRVDMRLPHGRTPRQAACVSASAIDEYLRSCLMEGHRPRASELARMVGVSRGTLIKAIKRLQGMAPGAYLKREQIACAKRLLRRGWSIERTARRAGYGTVRTFFRAFREATGVTPAVFRERERNVRRRPSGKRD